MITGMAGFIANDTIIKIVGATMPLGQLLFVRGVMATALITGLVVVFRQAFSVPRAVWPWITVRLLGEQMVTLSFLTALMNMPMANATAILQLTPIAMTFAAILVFGETVGWRRWTAIITGLIGVLIIIRPGMEGFSNYSLLVVVAVIGSVIRDTATRKLPKSVHNLTITAYTSAAISCTGLIMMTVSGNTIPLDFSIIGALFASAIFVLVGYFGLSAAVRQGDLAVVTPFRYSAFPIAIVLGYLAFGDLPDFWTVVGATIVIASGIVTIVRNIQTRHV